MTQALRDPLEFVRELLGEDLSAQTWVPSVGMAVAPAESTGYDLGQTTAPELPKRDPLEFVRELLGEEPVAPSRGMAYPIFYPQVEPTRESRPYEAPAGPSVAGPATFEPSGEGGIEVGRYDPNSLLTKAGARFSYALEDANLNDSAFLASVNPLSTPDDWQEIDRRDRDLERRRRAAPARSETPGLMGQVENAVLMAVEISGKMARGLLEGGIVGAGGAMVAAPTGPGAVVSGALTATAGAAQYWVRQGAGSMARAMRREGVPQDIAAPIAVGLGLPYALIEQSQVGKIVRGFDKKAARSLGGAASRAVARVVKQYGLEAGQEVGEEVAQELVAISAEEGAKALSNAMRGTELEGGSWSVLATRLKDTATGVGPGLAVLLLPGTAARALYGVNYETERTKAVGAFQRSIADLSPEQQQAVIAMLPPEGQQAVAGRVIAEAPTIPQRPADSLLEQEEKAALIHDIAATGAKPTQWLRDNVGKTFDKLTYYDLDLARRVLAGPEEGGGQERVDVPPEAQPVGEALAEEAEEAPSAVEAPPPAVSTPERAGEREMPSTEEQKAARPAAIPVPAEAPVAPAAARELARAPEVAPEAEAAPAPVAAPAARLIVTERPSYLELAYPDGGRGPEGDQQRLRAAKARFWKDKGVWRMATKGAGLTEEIVAQRRELVEELGGAEETAELGAAEPAEPVAPEAALMPPERAEVAERIVTAARKPMPEIVASYELKGSDGKWYGPIGFPAGVKNTGERRVKQYVYRGPDGTTFSNRSYKTAEEARTAWEQGQKVRDQELRDELARMPQDRFESQRQYWLKEPAPAEAAPAPEMKPATIALTDADRLRRLQSIEDQSNRRPYVPISDAERQPLIDEGLVIGRGKGKVRLSEEGRALLWSLARAERTRSNAEGNQWDEEQEALIRRIESGHGASEEELEKYSLGEGKWATRARANRSAGAASTVEGFERTTPRKGTPERETIETERKTLSAEDDQLYEQIKALREKVERSKSYDAKDRYRAQIDKLDERRAEIDKKLNPSGTVSRHRLAYLEDVIEEGDEANRLAAQFKLGTQPGNAHERMLTLAREEAERQGAGDLAEQVALSAEAYISSYPGLNSLANQVKTSLGIERQNEQRSQLQEKVNRLTLHTTDRAILDLRAKANFDLGRNDFKGAEDTIQEIEQAKDTAAKAEEVEAQRQVEQDQRDDRLVSQPWTAEDEVAWNKQTKGARQAVDRWKEWHPEERPVAGADATAILYHAGMGDKAQGAVLRQWATAGVIDAEGKLTERGIAHLDRMADYAQARRLGVSMNQYVPGKGMIDPRPVGTTGTDAWFVGKFHGKPAYSNGGILLQGEPPADGVARRENIDLDAVVPGDLDTFVQSHAIGATLGNERGPDRQIWMSDGRALNADLYDAVFKNHPEATLWASPKKNANSPYLIKVNGELVGLLMPISTKDIDAPLGIRRLQGKVQPESGEERSTILASGFNPLDALKSPVRLAQMAAEELTPKPSPYAFDATLGEEFAEIEERMRGARGLGRVPVGERLEEGFSHFAALWTREWEHLPRGAEFARLRDALNKLKKQKGVASYKTLEAMQDAVEGLDEGQTDLFRRKVILDDLAYEVEQEHSLPFGFTPETLGRARKAVDAAVAQDEQVGKAIERRKQAWDNLKGTYVRAMKDIGFNADFILKNPNYFRHQVLEYARARRGGAPQGVGTLHTPSGRGMLRRREGSELDINSDYLEAEYEAMSQMFYDVEVARTIKVVDEEHNMLPDLKTQAKSHNYSAMLRALAPVAEERTAQLTPRQIEKRVEAGKPEYITPEEVYRQMLNWKQAKGFSELGKMAADGMLPNNGQWDDVIDGLAAQYIEGVQEAEAEAIGTSLAGRPDFDMPDTGEIMAYAGWLLKAHPGEPGSGAAALIFKGMSEKKQTVRKMLSEIGQFRTWEDFVPEGAVPWQPREGQVFFMADTVPARLVEKALEEGLEELGVPLKDLRKAMVMGGPRRQYVLDERVALTLENFTQNPGPWAKAFRLPLNLWKQSVLLGPHKWPRYNIRNMTGDADAAYVGNPSTFQALPRAITDLAGPILKGRKITGEVREWFERGGFGSSLSVQELEEVGDLRIWRDKFPKQDHNAFEALARSVKNKTWRAYWKAARISTDYREALLRYAAYLDYLGQMEKNGGVPNNWGASIREEVMALPDIRDRAFKLSNDLLGAYDEVSVAGQGLKRYAYPFWSWNEVNFRRYKRLMQNAYQDGKLIQAIGRKAMAKYGVAKETPEGFRGAYIAANVGRFVFRALTVWGVFEAWNRLLFPDDDDRLPEEVKGRPHLTFGEDEDGKIRYFSRIGALGDFLEWFGLDAAPTDVRDFVNGKRTLGEIVKDMALSPVEKVIHGASPYFKTPTELITRKQLFPDPWRPRTIRDRGLYLAQLIGLEKEYAWATDLPSKDASEAVPDLFMYRADPGQAAYSDLYEEKRRYLKTLGLEREGFVWSDRSNALYNARLATRYKDKDGQRKYMLEYFRLGGTMQGMRQSFAMMHPLQGIPKKQQAAFVDGLDNEDRLKLARAIDFYDRVLLGDGGPDRILYGNIEEVQLYLEPDEVRQELARLAADATLAGAGSEPDRRLVKLSRAEGGWKSYKARLDKKDRARLETAIHNHLTDRLQEMARLRAKVKVLTGAERKDALEDLDRLTKPYGGWQDIYRRFGLWAYRGAEKGVADWYHEYAQELRQERQAAAR